jgi:uncharacterized protein (DUF433 family)
MSEPNAEEVPVQEQLDNLRRRLADLEWSQRLLLRMGARINEIYREFEYKLDSLRAALPFVFVRHKGITDQPIALPHTTSEAEKAVSSWKHLVKRPHRWRKQLYLQGKNMTVGQLMDSIRTNGLSAEQAAEDMALPIEAVLEAIRYSEENKNLLDSEAAYERHLLTEGEAGYGARSVP